MPNKFEFKQIRDKDRMNFLPKYFDNCLFDYKLFDFANNLIVDYNGGYWLYGKINNIPVCILDRSEPYNMRNLGQEYFDDVDVVLGGMIVTFFALTLEIELSQKQKLMPLWDNLRNLIYDYAESIDQASIAFKILD